MIAPSDAEDTSEAVRWYTLAAKQGHALAQFKLGAIYYDGRGVTQDFVVAIKWFRKAAEQGVAEAAFNLGLMSGYGQGMAQDYAEAYKWYTLAMWKGSDLAAENRDALTDDMTPEQITEGRRRAVDFAAKNKIAH